MDIIESLKPAIVAILDDKGDINGTGFFITSDGYILTCYHVIQPALRVSSSVRIKSPHGVLEARFVEGLSRIEDNLDFAVLKVQEDQEFPCLPLGTEANQGDTWWTLGFELAKHYHGVPNGGTITGYSHQSKNSNFRDIILTAYNPILGGLSGSPVFNKRTNRVIGVIKERFDISRFDIGTQGHAISIEAVFQVWPGLIKLNSKKGYYQEYEDLKTIFAKQRDLEIRLIGDKYIPSIYTPRGSSESAFNRFIRKFIHDKRYNKGLARAQKRNKKTFEDTLKRPRKIFNCLLFKGEAGIGKTNLLCNLSQEYGNDFLTLIFVGNRMLIDSSCPISDFINKYLYRLSNKYPMGTDILSIAEEWSRFHDKYIIIFIDAINECLKLDHMKIYLSDIIVRYEDKNIAFVISCRDIDWNYFNSESSLVENIYFYDMTSRVDKGITLTEFSNEEFSKAWILYKTYFKFYGDISNEIKTICKQPIMLRFFADAYSKEQIPFKDIRRIQIFDQYWNKKLSNNRELDIAGPLLYSLVERMTSQKVTEILKMEVEELINAREQVYRNAFQKILSENIIIYKDIDSFTDEYKIGFTYEAFYEYVIAKYFLRMYGPSGKDVLRSEFKKLLDQIAGYRNYRGAVEYIIQLLENRGAPYIEFLEILWDRDDCRDDTFRIIGKLKDTSKMGELLISLFRNNPKSNQLFFDYFINNITKISLAVQTEIFRDLVIKENDELVIPYLINMYHYLPSEQKELLIYFSKYPDASIKSILVRALNAIPPKSLCSNDQYSKIPLDLLKELQDNLGSTVLLDRITEEKSMFSFY